MNSFLCDHLPQLLVQQDPQVSGTLKSAGLPHCFLYWIFMAEGNSPSQTEPDLGSGRGPQHEFSLGPVPSG